MSAEGVQSSWGVYFKMPLKLFFALLPSLIFLADQLTKIWVRNNFALGQTRPFIPFVDFTYITNTGTAFGLARGNNVVFIILSSIIICFIAVFKKKIFFDSLLSRLSYAFILGGAFGNLADRIMYGKVIDFIDLRFWPVFNIADSFISIGIGLFIFESVVLKRNIQ